MSKPDRLMARTTRFEVPPELVILSAIFVAGYFLFCFFSPAFTNYPPPLLSIHDASPSHLRWVWEYDGIETYIATAFTIASLMCGLIAVRLETLRRAFSLAPVQVVVLGVASGIVLATRSTELRPVGNWWLTFGLFAILIVVQMLVVKRAVLPRQVPRKLANWVFASLVVLVSLAFVGTPSPEDYGYYLGPALKLLQGEPIGSFYMQYGLGGTVMFAGMMKAGLDIGEMQLLLALLLSIGFAVYFRLARSLFPRYYLPAFFFVALIVARLFWTESHPASVPQASIFRIDLWLPVAFLATERRFSSPAVSAMAAFCFLFDSFFGLLIYSSYSAVLLASWAVEYLRSRSLPMRADFAAYICSILVVMLTGWFFLHRTSEGAKLYGSLRLGFLPISAHSLFWPLLLAILIVAWILVKSPVGKLRELRFFILILCVAHLVYFFGRSHDHNLINLSGLWLLLLFAGLCTAASGMPMNSSSLPQWIAASIIALIAVASVPRLPLKARIVGHNIYHHTVLNYPLSEKAIAASRSKLSRGDPVIILGMDDAYWNYRIGLRQEGYFAPIFADPFRNSLASFLVGEMSEGKRVWVTETVPDGWIALLNNTAFLQGRHQRLQRQGADSRFLELESVYPAVGR